MSTIHRDRYTTHFAACSVGQFTGKERDAESGLDNFGARYDSSTLGRFMTPDWAARPTTVPYAVFGDPQSLNLYGYVRNDPVSLADANGHWPDWLDKLFGRKEPTGGPPTCTDGRSGNDGPIPGQKLRINIIFSSGLTDKQRARAMGLLAHAEVGLGRAGIKTTETGSQTLNFDQIEHGKGMDKTALNVVFGTDDDMRLDDSGSNKIGSVLASFINIEKDGGDETIVQFEFAQALTITHSKLPLIGSVENGLKDWFFTPFLNAAMDGTPGSIKAANILTLGGVSEMKANSQQYSDPDQ